MLFNENHKSKTSGPPYYVSVDVNSGESLAIQDFDGSKKIITGPDTVTMLSHQAYPPIPLPVNVPPGHMMQQIVDENGILKHIIIGPNNSNEPMSKNQILTKNGAKLVPLNLTSSQAAKFSSSSSFKKKFTQSNGSHTESAAYKPSRYTNGLTSSADPLLNGSSGLLNANGLVYSSLCYYCCPQCPECLPNQLNSSSNSLFLNNELNYGRPTSYYSGGGLSNSSLSASGKSTVNSYSSKRSFNLNSSTNRASNGSSSANHTGIGYGKESSREKSKTSSSKSNNNCVNPNCNLNYSSSSYQPKGALLSTNKVCKQCPPPPDSSYTASYNQKYLYPAPPYSFPNGHYNQPNHLYQASPNKKYSYASSDPKQSPTNRNRALSNSSRGGGQLISQAPLLNGNGFSYGSTHATSKKESDCYSELIRYVNSNHISAFKSHKRIEHTKVHQQQANGNPEKERANSNSVTASSSPISEHYDFSSEESEQTNFKHTTLLSNPPASYHLSNGYSNGYANSYSSSNYSSSNYSANHSNNSINSTNSNGHANKKPVRVRKLTNERPVQDRSEVLKKNSIEKCNNLKNEQQNDERDDGYEGDDFELKNCDSKSNDEVLLEAEEAVTNGQPVGRNVETSKRLDVQTNQLNADDRSDPVSCELICEESCEETEKVLEDQAAGEMICDETGKILDENSNEVDRVDKNLSNALVMPQIVESLVGDNEEPLGYFDELNVEELNSGPEAAKNELNDERTSEKGVSEAADPANSRDEKQAVRSSTRRKQEIVRTVCFSLSYTKLTGNYVKLKWTVLNGSLYASAKDSQFMVEMIYSKRDEGQSVSQSSPTAKCSRIVYQGLSKSCKIQCLKELEEYSFRVKIVLSNDQQLISNLLTITTPELQIQPLNHFATTKKRTSKHNLQLNLQQEILKQQQIIIEQKEKELQLKQSQFHSKPAASSNSLVVIFCAICTLFKENFAYLLLIFFSISAFSFANFISDLLN